MVFSMDPEHPQAVRELIGSGFQNLPNKDQYINFKGREEAFLGPAGRAHGSEPLKEPVSDWVG